MRIAGQNPATSSTNQSRELAQNTNTQQTKAQPHQSNAWANQAPTQANPSAPSYPQANKTAFITTGAYQLSGDPGIDRMLQLEAACKRFGSPL